MHIYGYNNAHATHMSCAHQHAYTHAHTHVQGRARRAIEDSLLSHLHKYLKTILYPYSPADQNIYFANSIDPDETAQIEPSHQDLNCSLFCFDLLTETPIWKNGSDQVRRWKSPL